MKDRGPPRAMRTLGQHLATRLVEIGVTHVFGVPGNELNAGYAADGYARARGVGACVATFTVGGLSMINAIAGAYSEDLPVICITGGPNSNDSNSNKLLHHTIGLLDREQELRCFQQVTCAQAAVKHLDDAHDQVDLVIATALRERKPVYINIACNLAGETHPTFTEEPIPFAIYPKESNRKSLEAAVETAAEFLNSKGKCAIVAGVKVRSCHAEDALVKLADATQYPVTVMANAKSFFPEDHPNFIGTYWGQVSSPFAAEIVESADAYLVVGPTFNDYTTCGWSLLLTKSKTIQVDKNSITIGGQKQYHCIVMADFLTALSEKVQKNTKSMDIYRRMYTKPSEIPRQEPGTPLLTKTLYKHFEGILSHDTAVLAETGDSWFNCQKLKLPNGCRYEFQCQYGSIGWAVGATLGYSIGLGPKRLIASIGDGSFQVTAQDITTAMRFRQNPIIFLINNGGYTIEVEIHDGPYNKIQNWDYVKFIESMDNGNDQSWAVRVKTEEELEAAIQTATTEKADKLCFIEAIIHTDDCSRELLEWGSRVAAFNARPPNPQ